MILRAQPSRNSPADSVVATEGLARCCRLSLPSKPLKCVDTRGSSFDNGASLWHACYEQTPWLHDLFPYIFAAEPDRYLRFLEFGLGGQINAAGWSEDRRLRNAQVALAIRSSWCRTLGLGRAARRGFQSGCHVDLLKVRQVCMLSTGETRRSKIAASDGSWGNGAPTNLVRVRRRFALVDRSLVANRGVWVHA